MSLEPVPSEKRSDGAPLAVAQTREPLDVKGPENYINRELSFLEFNKRVLELATDPDVPLLERLRFLAISSINLDEFFEIRVAGLKQQLALGLNQSGPDGLSPLEIFQRVCQAAHELVAEQYRVLNEEILPALETEQIRVLRRDAWTRSQRGWVKEYFTREVLPVLTPVGLDPAHPFPRIVNKSLNFFISLEGKDAFGRQSRYAVVQAPRLLPRLIAVPPDVSKAPHDFVLLSSVIHAQVAELFPGMKVTGCYQFRVTRNSELWVDEEEIDDLLRALKTELPRRNYGDAVRLEVAENCSLDMSQFLLEQFKLQPDDIYRVNGPVNLHRLDALYELVDRAELKFPRFVPGVPPNWSSGSSIFDLVRQGDVLLHHPYQSFSPVVELVRQAAADPDVLAVKQTLYRVEAGSPLAQAHIRAAEAGKEVTVVVELRARFDEEANIELATQLQQAGAKVVYGVVGHKTHAKMLLIVRREGGALRRYVHLSTGNYHTRTARSYTDLSLLSANEELGEDVHNLFQELTGLGRVSRLKKIVQSPFSLHKTLLALIEQETEHARAASPARIIAKMNSLTEPVLIEALYRASQAGVSIDLIVRGVCCLRPGIARLSDNIRVRSILGRFLEHSRVYYFEAGGQRLTFCSSADWMPRNLFRRVETCFPVEDEAIRERVLREGLLSCLEDNTHAWELDSQGRSLRLKPGQEPPRNAQQSLLRDLAGERAVAEAGLDPASLFELA